MAKKSMIEREAKRAKLAARFAEKRAKLKAIINDREASDEDKWQAQMALQKMPRDASPVRRQRRCRITGRPHAVYRRFNISRIALRELGSTGRLPGVIKSSW